MIDVNNWIYSGQDIQLFGSHAWPSSTWVHIGNFTAQNVKKLQHFTLPETVWFKYIHFSSFSFHLL
jgi:hypothetical protein